MGGVRNAVDERRPGPPCLIRDHLLQLYAFAGTSLNRKPGTLHNLHVKIQIDLPFFCSLVQGSVASFKGLCPFALHSQIYASVPDRTAVDRELQASGSAPRPDFAVVSERDAVLGSEEPCLNPVQKWFGAVGPLLGLFSIWPAFQATLDRRRHLRCACCVGHLSQCFSHELQALCSSGDIRILRLPTAKGDKAAVLDTDYRAQVCVGEFLQSRESEHRCTVHVSPSSKPGTAFGLLPGDCVAFPWCLFCRMVAVSKIEDIFQCHF